MDVLSAIVVSSEKLFILLVVTLFEIVVVFNNLLNVAVEFAVGPECEAVLKLVGERPSVDDVLSKVFLMDVLSTIMDPSV